MQALIQASLPQETLLRSFILPRHCRQRHRQLPAPAALPLTIRTASASLRGQR